jgi:hypothetical protein
MNDIAKMFHWGLFNTLIIELISSYVIRLLRRLIDFTDSYGKF